jgi:hypothetical protein
MIGMNYALQHSSSDAPLFFCNATNIAAAMCFIYPDQQPSLLQFIRRGGLAALVKHTPARRWLAAMKASEGDGASSVGLNSHEAFLCRQPLRLQHQAALDKQKEEFLAQHGSKAVYLWLIAVEPELQGKGLGKCSQGDGHAGWQGAVRSLGTIRGRGGQWVLCRLPCRLPAAATHQCRG